MSLLRNLLANEALTSISDALSRVCLSEREYTGLMQGMWVGLGVQHSTEC